MRCVCEEHRKNVAHVLHALCFRAFYFENIVFKGLVKTNEKKRRRKWTFFLFMCFNILYEFPLGFSFNRFMPPYMYRVNFMDSGEKVIYYISGEYDISIS